MRLVFYWYPRTRFIYLRWWSTLGQPSSLAGPPVHLSNLTGLNLIITGIASQCTHILTSGTLSASKTQRFLNQHSRHKKHLESIGCSQNNSIWLAIIVSSVSYLCNWDCPGYRTSNGHLTRSQGLHYVNVHEGFISLGWSFINQFPNRTWFSPVFSSRYFSLRFLLRFRLLALPKMYGYSVLRAPCNSEVCLQALEPVQLVAPDGSVRANFIRYGATLTNFWVKDKVRSWFHQSCPFYTWIYLL